MLHNILLEAQDCALIEIEGSPVLWTFCEKSNVLARTIGPAARAQLCITLK